MDFNLKCLIIFTFICLFSIYHNLLSSYVQFDYKKINHIEILKNSNFLAYLEPLNDTCYIDVKNGIMISKIKNLIEKKKYDYYAIQYQNIKKIDNNKIINNIKLCSKPTDKIEMILLYLVFYYTVIFFSLMTLIILVIFYYDIFIEKQSIQTNLIDV